jgi:sarcosine oxidase subunit gamma
MAETLTASLVRRPFVAAGTPWLRVLPPATRLNLRGDAQVQAAAALAFGVSLSTVACRAVSHVGRAALWLGPDEQLLLAPTGEGHVLATSLDAELAALPHSLVDISHRQVGLEVHGPYAAWLLQAQCPLDLDLTAFPVEMCTRSVFAKTELILWRRAADVFHVEIARSLAAYFTGLLAEIAKERIS